MSRNMPRRILYITGLSPHPDRVMREVEALWVLPIARRLRALQQEFLELLGVKGRFEPLRSYASIAKGASLSYDQVLGFGLSHGEVVCKAMDREFAEETAVVKPYTSYADLPEWLRDQAARERTLLDLMGLIQSHLPKEEVDGEIERSAALSLVAGRLQESMRKLSVPAIQGSLKRVPVTPELTPLQAGLVNQVKLRSGKLLRDASQRLVAGVREEMENSVLENLTTRQVASRLFDRFATMNRDWRRIAVTEAGNVASDGYLDALPVGSVVRSLEAYMGVCEWCREHSANRKFTVVSPDEPNKDPDHDVWVGKSNYGMKQDQWRVASGPNHPHCRKVWTVVRRAGKE